MTDKLILYAPQLFAGGLALILDITLVWIISKFRRII